MKANLRQVKVKERITLPIKLLNLLHKNTNRRVLQLESNP